MQERPDISAFIFSTFDTGIVIDTAMLGAENYFQYSSKTLALLQKTYPHAIWGQEDSLALRGKDDPIDFFPIFNLSYIKASCPKVLSRRTFSMPLPSGITCVVNVADPIVYFHTFSAGTISMEVSLSWSKPYTADDLHQANHNLLGELASLVETELQTMIQVFGQAVKDSQCPIYKLPFKNLMPVTISRKLLYWSHFVYIAKVPDGEDYNAASQWLIPLMQPVTGKKVENMALKPNRYIYLGWGRSIICCEKSLSIQTVYSYVHMLEIKNYLWKTLYDLDRGLRNAMIDTRGVHSDKETLQLSYNLHALDFHIEEILENIDIFKINFDYEKIWLSKWLDENWLIHDLIASLQKRLQSFRDLYDYDEEITKYQQEKRLQSVLNIIAVVAISGTITGIVQYFDPLNKLSIAIRAVLFFSSLIFLIFFYILTIAIVRQIRHRRD